MTIKVGHYGQNQKLIEARRDKGVTRADVAYACNLTAAGLTRIEHGQRFGDWATMYKLARYYHTTVDKLFFENLARRAKYHSFYYKLESSKERQQREAEEVKKRAEARKKFARKYEANY